MSIRHQSNRNLRWARLGPVLVGSCCLAVTACGSTTHRSADPPSAANANATAGPVQPARPASCALSDLPSGFTLDAAHSGLIQPNQYSESGDMQAAMVYDGYSEGLRDVYTHLNAPAGDSLVIQCFDLAFATAAGAQHFTGSYQMLRADDAPTVKPLPHPPMIGTVQTIGYVDSDQSFAGYRINSITVLELSAQVGQRYYNVSIAGPNPSPSLAAELLQSMGVA